METNAQKYELSQNGKKYILSTQINGEYVKLTCLEAEIPNPLIYIGEFSLIQLRRLSSVFNTISLITQAQELLNQTIENQKVSVEPQGNILNIVLYLTSETESEDSFSLKMGLNNPQNLAYNQPLAFQSVNQQTNSQVNGIPNQFVSLDTTNRAVGIPLYENQINIPNVETNTTTTTTQDIFSTTPIENTTTKTQDFFSTTPIENTITNTTQDMFTTTPIENTTTTTTQDMFTTTPIENTTTTTTQDMFATTPIENTTTTTTQDFFSTTPIENTTTTTTQDMFTTTPIENTTTTTTQDFFSTTPIENTTTTTTQDMFPTTPIENTTNTSTTYENYQTYGNINAQNYDNSNTQNFDNFQNYENLNLNANQPQTDTYKVTSTQKTETVTLPLNPSIDNGSYENQNQINNNQDFNKYLSEHQTTYENQNPQYFSQPQNEAQYIIPTVDQSNSPKREQIQYSMGGSPSNGQFTYSTPESNNPDMFNQKKIVETTTTTTKDYQYNPNDNLNSIPIQENPNINTERITQLQNEITKLREENNSLSNEANNLRGEVGQLRNQVQILTEENKILREKNGAMPTENQIHEISILKQENEQLRKQIEQYLNNQNNFEQYKKLKEDEINLLKLKIQELLKNQKKLEDFILQKQKEIEDLKFQIQQLIKNINISESQNYIMRQQQGGSSRMGSIDHQTLTIQDTRLEIVKGDIIKSTEELEFLTRRICQNHKKITLDLLYKATIDSDKAVAFHNKCDMANSTLVLVKSGNGKRFGGFTTCDWKGNSIEKKDENAFVFSLDKMQIYDIIPGEDAIGCYPKYGPVFLGCQIRIYDEFFTKGGTTFEKGLNYNTQEDYELTGGLKKFDVKEIEVYSVELE